MKRIFMGILTILAFIGLYSLVKPDNKIKKQILNPVNESSAKEEVSKLLNNYEISSIKNKSLVVKKDDNHMILVVNNQYLYIDFNVEIPKIYHFKSDKAKIKARVVRKNESGFVIEHDGHEDYIEGTVPDNKDVGDIVTVDDPHAHLSGVENHGKKDHKENNLIEQNNFLIDAFNSLKNFFERLFTN
ncbi:MAG: hypothetical protein Q4A42_01135 [Tissierellia bacterium]|nr:hypothetical protein [Tissierellia bacterium]